MITSAGLALTLAAKILLGSNADADLVRCRATARNGEATIQVSQTHRVRDVAKGGPHYCSAEVTVEGSSGSMRRVYADIEPVGAQFGVAILPNPIERYRAVAKLGDYDGRLLLVDAGGGVVDLPGPAHFLAYGRMLIVEHHSDVYAVTVYDVSANVQVFAADDAVLANLLGTPVGDPARWLDVDGTIYLAPPSSAQGGPVLRLDNKHGGLIPARLSAERAAKAKPVHFSGLEGWQDCSCGPGTK